MIVAISQRNMKMGEGANRDALENDYIKYFENLGVTLLPIPNVLQDLEEYFDNIPIIGVILSGGNYVNPVLYGAESESKDVSEQRDNTEKKLIGIAIKRKLPLLGICRGMQFINVFFKGSLIQNVQGRTGIGHVGINHQVRIIDNKVADFFIKKEFTVNSYHEQCIDKKSLSSELKPFAISDEGIIEGIYHPKYAIAGIQWHPERKSPDGEFNKKIIKAFLDRELFWG